MVINHHVINTIITIKKDVTAILLIAFSRQVVSIVIRPSCKAINTMVTIDKKTPEKQAIQLSLFIILRCMGK